MYEMLALLTGLILSVMVSVNGNLSGSFGVFRASVIIHVVGILFAFLLCTVRRENRKLSGHAQPGFIWAVSLAHLPLCLIIWLLVI